MGNKSKAGADTVRERAAAKRVNQTNWREKLQASKIKFDDEAKARYLKAYAETGNLPSARKAAGVAYHCVTRHLENDPDFAEACEEALNEYKSKLMKLWYRTFDGSLKKPIVGGKDKDEIVTHETIIHPGLLHAEMKRHYAEYKEGAGQAGGGTGGGVLALETFKTQAEVDQAIADFNAKHSVEPGTVPDDD